MSRYIKAYKQPVKFIIDIDSEEHELVFLSAAIRFRDLDNDVILEQCGQRFVDIIREIRDAGYTQDYRTWHEQGFMYMIDGDGSPRFMDRETATEIAQKTGFPLRNPKALTTIDLW